MSLQPAGTQAVMVVDDMADLREVIALWLRSLGFDVVEAADGREAVELAPQVHPDLILMDLRMPVLDGLEAARLIHEREETRDVPVVAVTAFTDSYSRQEALDAGCVGHVGKPVDFAALDGVIHKHLNTQYRKCQVVWMGEGDYEERWRRLHGEPPGEWQQVLAEHIDRALARTAEPRPSDEEVESVFRAVAANYYG